MRLSEFFLIAAFLFSCSSGNYYSERELKDFLTNERIYSQTGEFSVLKPYDWNSVKENKFNSKDLWLVKDDDGETITLNKINAKPDVTEHDVLLALINYRKINYGGKLNGFEQTEVRIGNKILRGFKYADDSGKNVFVYLCKKNNLTVEAVYETELKSFSPVVLAVLNSLEKIN